MIDMINRGFAALARQHYGIYALLGVIISLLFLRYAEPDAQLPFLKKLIYPVLFITITNGFLLRSFYERSEYGGKKVPMRGYSFVIKDDYFLAKITSNISIYKKILGYLYVIFSILNTSVYGFLSAVILVMLAKGA